MGKINRDALTSIAESYVRADQEQKAFVLGYLTGAADQKESEKAIECKNLKIEEQLRKEDKSDEKNSQKSGI